MVAGVLSCRFVEERKIVHRTSGCKFLSSVVVVVGPGASTHLHHLRD